MCIYDILWLPSLLDTVRSTLETKHICTSIYVSIMQTNCVNGSSSSRKHSTHCFQWVVNSCLSFTSAWAAASALRRNGHSVLELSLVIKQVWHRSPGFSLEFDALFILTFIHSHTHLITVALTDRDKMLACEWQLKCFCFVLPPKHNFQAT